MSPPLYLASRSPRRKELLAQAGLRFQVFVPSEEEVAAPKTRRRVSARAIVRRISAAKAVAAENELRGKGVKRAVVLAADTLVFQHHEVLGKPKNKKEAIRMLKSLAGKWHDVYTGVTVVSFAGKLRKQRAIQIRTKVRFFRLGRGQIERYVTSGEPFDKAGGYGIQGLGASLVEEIRGSYTNVVGLPVGQVLALLEKTWPGRGL